jgi:hypothetical protein
MNTRLAALAGLLVMAAMFAACGEKLTSTPTAPTGPTTLYPLLLPRLGGLWGGSVTLTGIAGGTGPARDAGALECVGAAFNAVIGETNDNSLSITQNGTNLTARLTSAGTGLRCEYTGRVGSNGFVSLDAASCAAPELVIRCHPDANGDIAIRRMQLVGSSITASIDAPVNVTTVSGTAAHTYNIISEDGDVGALVANHTFAGLTRR